MNKKRIRKSPKEQIRILESKLKKTQDPLERESIHQAIHHWRMQINRSQQQDQ
jgi:hypothetical protein